MRTCASCGHLNADHLTYCFGCGRRLGPSGPVDRSATSRDEHATLGAIPANAVPAAPAFAATVAVDGLRLSAPGSDNVPARRRHLVARAYDSARYVFTTIRGRMDADERRRRLIKETDGARRLAEGTLFEIGQTVLAQGIAHPELGPLTTIATQLRARREAVVSDLAAAEKFQASEDLRLGLLEAASETEWKSCDHSARALEAALGKNEVERREAKDTLARHHAARIGGGPAPATDRVALEDRCRQLDEQHRALRERAAALRASSLAARTRLDQAAVARKQSAAAVAASVTGHARERGELDAELRKVSTQIGTRAVEARIASPFLTPAYQRFDRLQDTVRTRQSELGRLERSRGGIDRSRFATGLGLILAVLGVCGAGLWAILR